MTIKRLQNDNQRQNLDSYQLNVPVSMSNTYADLDDDNQHKPVETSREKTIKLLPIFVESS